MEISIRKFRESDAEEFHAAVLESVEHVSEWLPWCTPAYSLQNAQEHAQDPGYVMPNVVRFAHFYTFISTPLGPVM